MKTAQLPPVRVRPAVREEIQQALREGESLSEFVEAAALQAARQRQVQAAFLARGRAALAQAKQAGEFYSAPEALDAMQERLNQTLLQRLQARGGTAKP